MSRRPRLVLISGSPGSGKTTLAAALAARTRLLHVSKDKLTSGLARTDPTRAHDDLNVAGWRMFWAHVERLVDDGVSHIAEQTMWRGQCEEPIRAIAAKADVLNLHCRCPHALDRWEARLRRDGIILPRPIDDFVAATHARTEEFVDPLDHGCPVVEVATCAEYAPGLDDLAAMITS